jgi:peptidoglycan/LPS O-acetylase OafA/YrhL
MSQQDGNLRGRVAGLDSLRFVCAFIVVLGHGVHPPLMEGADKASHWLVFLLNGLINNLYNGPAAVIVFFVLSGFCIHWPYRDGSPFRVGEFLARRLVRIGLPLLVAVGVGLALNMRLLDFNATILWSLFAEIIYYALYPVILPLARRFGFTALVVVAYVLAAAVVVTQPNPYGNYPAYGQHLTWVVGLPCWLVGCWLAERMRPGGAELPVLSERRMWFWRAGMFGLMVLLSGLRFHTPLKYQYTLDFFALAVVWYLAREIPASQRRPPAAWLERVGRWSYSLYLTHLLALAFFLLLPVPNLGYFFNWWVKLTLVLVTAYGFYQLVERPSHVLAQRIGRASTRPRAAGASELAVEASSSAPRT